MQRKYRTFTKYTCVLVLCFYVIRKDNIWRSFIPVEKWASTPEVGKTQRLLDRKQTDKKVWKRRELSTTVTFMNINRARRTLRNVTIQHKTNKVLFHMNPSLKVFISYCNFYILFGIFVCITTLSPWLCKVTKRMALYILQSKYFHQLITS